MAALHGLVDRAVFVIDQQLFRGPAPAQNLLELWLHQGLEAKLNVRIELEDRLPRATDQAPRFAMRQGGIAANQIQGQIDDHPDPAKAATLVENGFAFCRRMDLGF